MTVDVNVLQADDDFLDDIDDIMEETMVQMFILQPKTLEALELAKTQAQEYTPIFYTAPLSLYDEADENCVGYFVDNIHILNAVKNSNKPLFIEESLLDDTMLRALENNRGIILNATRNYEQLEQFYLSIGAQTIDAFDTQVLAALPMNKLVLQSGYPNYGFDTIFETTKRISDTMFRPDQSIIAAATKSSLTLFGFKKG